MQVQVSQSVLGAFVPQFLLNFKGDSSLQSYFRRVLKTNYQKGVVKLDFGHCQSCCLTLTCNDKPRTKSSQPMTTKLRKLLARSVNEPLSKYHAYQVKKFQQSSTLLIVRCPSCGHVNKKPIISNEEKLALKDKLIKNSVTITEHTPSVTKKKKKKKKKKKTNDNSGLIIPASEDDQTKSATEYITASPMEVSRCSPLVPEMSSTPLSTPREVATSWGSSLPTKMPNKSTPAQNYFSKGVFSTPSSRKLSGSLSDFHQRASQQKQKKTSQSSVQANRKMNHKQLQEFLTLESTSMKKPASLADFLSSL